MVWLTWHSFMSTKFHATTLIYYVWASIKATTDICSKRSRIKWKIRHVYCSTRNMLSQYIYLMEWKWLLFATNNKLQTLIWNVESILALKIVAITFVLCVWASRKANKMNKIDNNRYTMWNKQGIDLTSKQIIKPTKIWLAIHNTLYHLLLLWCNSYSILHSFFRLKNW